MSSSSTSSVPVSVMVPKAKDELSNLWWWSSNNPSEDLGTLLWTNPGFKDFQILIGDRILHVHKCVLAVKSPVFAAMLTSGLTETQTGQMKIQDFDYDIVKRAIKYFYTGSFGLDIDNVNVNPEIIWKLLTFGHLYDIKTLIRACLLQIKNSKISYNKYEWDFLCESAYDLDCDQIIDSIQYTLGSYEGLAPEYCRLYPDDSFKDLKIICDDGTEFLVHKFVLALKSPIFAQIFEKMAEDTSDTSDLGQLTINKFKPVVIENAVRFFYTASIIGIAFANEPDLLLGLLEFADRFKVKKLVTLCLQKIDQVKNSLGRKRILIYIKTAANFESTKILGFILKIFGTLRFDPFDLKKASKESYWN